MLFAITVCIYYEKDVAHMIACMQNTCVSTEGLGLLVCCGQGTECVSLGVEDDLITNKDFLLSVQAYYHPETWTDELLMQFAAFL